MSPSNNTFPAWVRDAVFYQVYPQSFYDTNNDGIGDLRGIIEKLPYLSKLGVTALWLSPFYPSPMRDAGYDVADYCGVDPRYGTEADARELFSTAKELGLRIIIDLVPGHTSIDHPWFKESARMDAARPYKNWYIWTESAWNDGGEPWNKKMIHGYSNRDGNFLINFFWSQPALNFGFAEPDPSKPWQLPTTHPDVQALWKEMRSIMRHWLSMGASGFRVDMADTLIRRDPQSKEIRRLWREAREELELDFPELFLIAEGYPGNLLDGTGFHSAFLHWAAGYWQLFRKSETRSQTGEVVHDDPYFNRSGTGDFRPFLQTWNEARKATRGNGLISVPLGNHDLPRVAVGQSVDELEMVHAFSLAWPGIPFLYYGDEIGLPQQSSKNPIHEGHYPTRNGARTPMQWQPGLNFGFSDCHPSRTYLPVDPEPTSPNVADEETKDNSLLKRVRGLIELKRKQPAFLADADLTMLADGAPGEPLAFIRGHGPGRLLCFFMPKAGPFTWSCPDPTALQNKATHLHGSPNPVSLQEGALQGTGPAYAFIRCHG